MLHKTPGRPEKRGADVAERVPGMPRFSVEVTAAMLARLDAEAEAHDRSRVAEVRVLLTEALARRPSPNG